jgi:hypothetical protein
MALARFSWAIAATSTIIEIAAELLPTLVASYFHAATAQYPNPITAAAAELIDSRYPLRSSGFRHISDKATIIRRTNGGVRPPYAADGTSGGLPTKTTSGVISAVRYGWSAIG